MNRFTKFLSVAAFLVVALGIGGSAFAQVNSACTALNAPYNCCTGSTTGTCTGAPGVNLMRAPAGFTGGWTSPGGNLIVIPSANGTYALPLSVNMGALIGSGWRAVDVGADLAATTAAFLPSATLATYGTPVVQLPASGYADINPAVVQFVTTSVGSETLTMEAIPTYSDATTGSAVTITATTSTTTPFTQANIASLYANGKAIVSIAYAVKSSINSSTASVTAVTTAPN